MAANVSHAIEYERAILGCIMAFDTSMADCHDADLSPLDFYLTQNQILFEAMLELDRRQSPIDLITVTTYLRGIGKLEIAGGEDYISDLADAAVSPTVVPAYITEIQNKAQRRSLAKQIDEINNLGEELTQDEFLDLVETKITSVTRNRRGSDFETGSEITSRVLAELGELKNQKGITGIKTDLVDLDRRTNGFHRGDLIILAARPAMGKSALALNFANMVARNNEGNVAIFSLEMPADQLMKRLMSCESRIFSDKLRSGKLTDEEMSKLHKAANVLSERKLFIDDTSMMTPNLLYSKCKKLRSEHGDLSLVVIDYLQLLDVSNPAVAANRQQAVSEISRKLKLLAKDLDVPVIALSQLSRKVEERTDHEPQLSDLRESGSIEQDADIVMFLNRKDYYDREQDNESEEVDIILAKHRNGSTGKVNAVFQKNISRFSNLARGRE